MASIEKPVRIVSDGSIAGTAVYDAEDRMLPYVTGFTIHGHISGETVKASVEFDLVALDLIAESSEATS